MNTKSLKGAATGFFFAGIIVFIFFYWDEDGDEVALETATTEPVVQQSALDYYTDEALLIELQDRDLTSPEDEQTEVSNETESSTESELYITIADGMTSSDVAEILSEAGMVDSADSFQSTLLEQGRESHIQTGLHRIHSEQSIEEIIESITS